MRPVTQSRTLVAADPNGICEDQQLGAAGFLTINGAFETGGVAFLDVQRQVELESAGNIAAINFTVAGTDEQDRPISETLAGPNVGTVATSLDFFTVTSVFADDTFGSDVEIGTNALGGSIPIPVDQYLTPTNIGLGVEIDAADTVDVTVQHTFGDIFSDDSSTIHVWMDHATLVNVTTDDDGNLAFAPRAVRLLTNSGTDPATLVLVQAGASG